MVSKVFIALCVAAVLFSSSVDAGYNWASVLNSGQLQHGDVRGPSCTRVCAWHFMMAAAAVPQFRHTGLLIFKFPAKLPSIPVRGVRCWGRCVQVAQALVRQPCPGQRRDGSTPLRITVLYQRTGCLVRSLLVFLCI